MNTGRPKCTILYIEDDPDDVWLFRRAFTHSRIACEIQNVNSVEDAETYLSNQPPYSDREKHPLPTLIITDLAFRGQSGVDFLTWLRNHPAFASIPVLCLSGTEDPRKLEQARTFGAICIPKSSMYQKIMSVIESIVSETAHRTG